jgi:predicted O-methyltransferase YrrM
MEQQAQSSEAWFEIPFAYRGYGEYKSIRPKQVIEEIKQLFFILVDLSPKNICEIGTYAGGTFYLWCKAASEQANLFSVDLPGGLLNAYSPNRIEFYKRFARSENQKLTFFAYDSHLDSTFELVASQIGENKLDFLFIDGDHRYEGVKRDFECYSSLVKKGGIIAFHDILPRSDTPDVQVFKLWAVLKREYKYQEIIAQNGQFANKIGIGLIWME